ncbi:Mitoferrin [Dactylellina cionopaga]|nr:Mitoferrin [Dactylellina cionopaga]
MTSREPNGEKKRLDKTPIIAGGIAGLVSRFCIAPLDVVKIRLQLQPQLLTSTIRQNGAATSAAAATLAKGDATAPMRTVYKGIYGTMSTIIKEEGITALWKGNIPAELLYLTYGASQFFIYSQCQQLFSSTFQNIPTGAINTLSGGLAGGIATSITYPFDLLRTRFAASKAKSRSHGVYRGLSAAVRGIYADEGIKGFYRGGFAAIVQIVPHMGLFFGSYEGIKAGLKKAGQVIPSDNISDGRTNVIGRLIGTSGGTIDVVSGILGGIVAKTGVFPLDTIRKRLQVQGPTRGHYVHGDIPVYEGVVKCGIEVVRREGWRGLYRGLTVSLVKAAPASAITMWTYGRAVEVIRWVEREKDI